MFGDGISFVDLGAVVVIAAVVISLLLRAISNRRPERTPFDRDQAMAEIRTLTGRGAEAGEPEWDAQVRGTPPTTDGGGG